MNFVSLLTIQWVGSRLCKCFRTIIDDSRPASAATKKENDVDDKQETLGERQGAKADPQSSVPANVRHELDELG